MLLKLLSPVLACGLTFAVCLSASEEECLDDRCVVTDPGDISPWPTTLAQASRVPRESALAFLIHSRIRSVHVAQAVQEYQFASLERGKVHLVAVVEGGGTVGANRIAIAHCNGGRCTQDFIGSAVPIDLADVLVSARGDGMSQLLTFSILGMLGSSLRELGYWQLYELGPRGPALVTGRYRSWLHTRLQQRETEALRAASTARQREDVRAESAYAAAYLNDKLGTTRGALSAYAKTWSHADAEEIRKLVALARDEAPQARARQQYLQHWEKHPYPKPQPRRHNERGTAREK